MIKLVDFSKKYSLKSSNYAVQKVSFVAEKGVTCLLGLNGAGKTSIIKAVTGIHFPTEGKILISDKDGNFYDSVENREKCNSLIGYIPEVSDLPNNLYVKEFIHFCGNFHGLKGQELSKAVEKTVYDCSLEEVFDKKIGVLSKGFRQRVQFARALIHNPENLIFDESVNGLDPAQIIQFRNLIKKISLEKTILISTHLMQEVQSLCQNIIILNKGKMIEKGTEAEIVSRSSKSDIEQAFISLCTEN